MAASNKLLGKFCTAVKQMEKSKVHAPWNLIKTTQIVYNDVVFGHAFRKGTMPTTVKLYPAIIKAVEMFQNNTQLQADADAPDFLMVSKPAVIKKDPSGNPIRGKEYCLELLWKDGSATIMTKKGDEIRISELEPDGTNNPVGEFKTMTEYQLAGIFLLCLPEILEEDQRKASGKISEAISNLASFIPDFPSWASEADIPELAKESAFFMDAAFCYANDNAHWQFADPSDTTATIPEQVPDGGFKGATVVCSNSNVAFHYAVANGTMDGGSAKAVTIGEAKAEFSTFSSHRNWTAAERMMIPSFSDDTPVMPETIRIARRIARTRDAVNPVENVMWRGVTSYGKSTGVKQLACILNVPLMILTCHPGMEISEFKSTFVPESEDDGLELDMGNITVKADDELEMNPNLQLAIQNVSKMERDNRKAFLSGTSFFMEAMMDAESAAFTLFGEDVKLDSEDLCKVYTDVICFFREKPLRLQLSQMDSAEKQPEKKDDKPGFKHVMSPYMKALINGYIVEIQEPSRIRDSGVLVGINEYDRAGAVVHLMNGAMARRHKDAICIMTDNVGYASCRPIDPSVLRRQGMIIDSYELSEQLLKDRVRRNTGCQDTSLLNRCYDLWVKVKEYCQLNSITEGSVSPMELERFVQAMMLDGDDYLDENLADCVVSKATSSIEDQRDIKTACGLC